MEWFVFALLAPVLWGISTVIDKFVISKSIRNPFIFPVVWGCACFTFAIFIFIFAGVSFIFPYSLFAILIGILPTIYAIFYAKSMIIEDASVVIILSNISPIFVVLLSMIFLNEILTLPRYVGIFLLVFSAILISYRKNDKRRTSIKSKLKFILPLPILASISLVVGKYLLNHISYWSLYFWGALGILTIGLSFLSSSKIRKEVFLIIKKPRVISLIFTSEFFAASATILSFIAISLSPVSLVSALGSLTPFFVLVYTTILTIFLPRLLKEDINKHVIILKFLAVVLIFLGTYLIIG